MLQIRFGTSSFTRGENAAPPAARRAYARSPVPARRLEESRYSFTGLHSRNRGGIAAACLALCLIVALLPGCAINKRINQQMASWVGAPASELIATVGPPSQVFRTPDGGWTLVWRKDTAILVRPPASYTTGSATWLGGNHIYTQARTVYDPGQAVAWSSYRMFITDAAGVITNWRWQGL